jgi:ankyrin repeat protein
MFGYRYDYMGGPLQATSKTRRYDHNDRPPLMRYSTKSHASCPPSIKKERMNRIDLELRVAARENNLPEVSRLLSVGADVNVKDDNGWTPLHWASNQGHVQVFKELVDHGADIDAEDPDGWTPLHWACFKSNVALVNELLSRGANTEAKANARGQKHNTPLHWASMYDHLTIVKALVNGGANILATNNDGHLPVHKAFGGGHSAVAKYLLQQMYATTRRLPLHELLKDLTWTGDPNSIDILDVPPLRILTLRNVLGTDDVVEILEYLVDRNPTLLSSRDEDTSLPIHVACRRGAPFAIVQSLVNRYKVSVKSRTPQGDLPLFLACEMPETSLDSIFLLMKLYPELVLCYVPVVSIARTTFEDLLSDSNALSQQAMLLEKALEENKQLKADIVELKSEPSAKDEVSVVGHTTRSRAVRSVEERLGDDRQASIAQQGNSLSRAERAARRSSYVKPDPDESSDRSAGDKALKRKRGR